MEMSYLSTIQLQSHSKPTVNLLFSTIKQCHNHPFQQKNKINATKSTSKLPAFVHLQFELLFVQLGLTSGIKKTAFDLLLNCNRNCCWQVFGVIF